MRAKTRTCVLTMAVAAMLAAGCLDFDEQSIYMGHDRANDRLIFVIHYKGLYAATEPSSESKLDKAKDQLRKAVNRHTVALLGNWPFSWALDEVRADLRDPQKLQKNKIPKATAEELLTLLGRVEVRGGGFYEDFGGRVCGMQVVTVGKPAETIAAVNKLANEHIIKHADEIRNGEPWEIKFLEAARKDHAWLELKGQSLIFTAPLPEHMFVEGREGIAEDLDKMPEDIGAFVRRVRAIARMPVLVWHEDDVLRVKIGWQKRLSRLTTKPAEGKYRPNLAGHIRQEYGLKLDERLLTYMLDPEAPAADEAEAAARIAAPRLRTEDKARVLVRAIHEHPRDELWKQLRRLPPPKGVKMPPEIDRPELLIRWEDWLRKRGEPPKKGESEK